MNSNDKRIKYLREKMGQVENTVRKIIKTLFYKEKYTL